MPKVLLVEDNVGLREQMKWALAEEFEVLEAETLEGALEAYRKDRPQAVCLDMGLENKPERGLDLIDALLTEDRQAKIVVITSNTTTSLGARSVERGAFDFLQKPVDIEELKVILARACRLVKFEQATSAVQAPGRVGAGDFLMLGASEPMKKIFGLIEKLSRTDVNVLITGESGTGKELCARAIHYHSRRANEPFVPIKCGAIPESLMESELFGYVRGAFTGANADKTGLIEAANKGTLFLDEIGDMPMHLQVKLLRFLQEQRVQRVGDTRSRIVDVRVIAATNKTGLAEKDNESMRTDLYYRLSEFEILLPPLRDRGDDVLSIAQRVVEKGRERFAQPRLRLSKRAEKSLIGYSWPGNVRELENKLNRAAITCVNQTIEPEDLQLGDGTFADLTYREARQLFERNYILGALKRANGNVSLAAKAMGITRPTLYDMIKKNGVVVQMEAKIE